jgi:hypothetical protein
VVILLAALAVLAGIVLVASGRGGEMAYEHPDYPPLDLGPVTAADVALLRPPSAAWGYNMRVTDEALAQIARAMSERDVRISALEQRVSDLHEELSRGLPGRPRAQHRAPGGEQTRPDFATELPRPVWPPATDIVAAAAAPPEAAAPPPEAAAPPPEGDGQAADAAPARPGPAGHWAGRPEPPDEQTADDVAPGAGAQDPPEERPEAASEPPPASEPAPEPPPAPEPAPEQQPAGGPPWAFRPAPRPGPGGNGGPLGRPREDDEAGD